MLYFVELYLTVQASFLFFFFKVDFLVKADFQTAIPCDFFHYNVDGFVFVHFGVGLKVAILRVVFVGKVAPSVQRPLEMVSGDLVPVQLETLGHLSWLPIHWCTLGPFFN